MPVQRSRHQTVSDGLKTDGNLLIDWFEGDIWPQDAMEIMETDQQLNNSATADEESDLQFETPEEDTARDR
jgi:hypothetical protein